MSCISRYNLRRYIMEKFAFETFERDEERGVSIFDIKVIEADSFGEA